VTVGACACGPQVMAKIEKPSAVKELEAVVAASDGC
jgi:pyruvate kinase